MSTMKYEKETGINLSGRNDKNEQGVIAYEYNI